jgi:AraC family transcriptional regulator
MSDGYGQRFGERVRVKNAPAIAARVLGDAQIAATEIRCDNPLPGTSRPVQHEDAFVVGLLLRDFPGREYWEGGRLTGAADLRAGQICLYDLKRDPMVLLDKPYHCICFYLPRAVLDAIAEDADASRIGDLNYRPGAGIDDLTIAKLGSTMLPALSRPEQANRLFVDHVMIAVGAHVAQTYGGMQLAARQIRGGLAPWQVRRAIEILSANLDGVALKEVAQQCRLSVSHFSRAFRRSIGVAPHNWLLMRRVEVAKEKLRDGRLPLSELASACGFVDQSHLTRVFTRMVGVSPDAWRRARQIGKSAETANSKARNVRTVDSDHGDE